MRPRREAGFLFGRVAASGVAVRPGVQRPIVPSVSQARRRCDIRERVFERINHGGRRPAIVLAVDDRARASNLRQLIRPRLHIVSHQGEKARMVFAKRAPESPCKYLRSADQRTRTDCARVTAAKVRGRSRAMGNGAPPAISCWKSPSSSGATPSHASLRSEWPRTRRARRQSRHGPRPAQGRRCARGDGASGRPGPDTAWPDSRASRETEEGRVASRLPCV